MIGTHWNQKTKKKWTSHEGMLSLLIGKGTKLWDIVGHLGHQQGRETVSDLAHQQ
jgi:hypothetical protein